MKGFDRDTDSSILAFVILCETMKAITFDELKEYLYLLIKENKVEDLPGFIWDLLDLSKDNRMQIYKSDWIYS